MYKALTDLTLEEVERPLLHLEGYTEDRSHYKFLIRIVLKAGLTREAYEELVLGSALELTVPKNEEQKARFFRVRKSLTLPQRIFLLKYFTKDPVSLPGEDVGLFLMDACGLRNNEACATNYGDLRNTPGSRRKCLWVYKSTAEKSHRIKASGKTSNANRYIPTFTLINRFLEIRMSYLQGLIDNGTIKGKVKKAEELPVVCHGNNYLSRCQADDLGRAAKKLFRNLPGFDKQPLSILDEEAHRSDSDNQINLKDVEEKDPTAYLFRHDYATTVHCLGLTEPEIEYCIGHEMERTESSRNDYSNADVLKRMSEKLQLHPANRLFYDTVPRLILDDRAPNAVIEGSKIYVHLSPGGYSIAATAKEPNELIKIVTNANADVEVTSMFFECQHDKTINIAEELFATYKAEAERQGLKRPDWI